MAEDKVEPREVNWRQLMPWTTLFQGFRVALDPNKLILAAFGILFMAFGWWLLAVIFDYKKPDPSHYLGNLNDYGTSDSTDKQKTENAWNTFKEDRKKWYVMHHAAGDAFPTTAESDKFAYDAGDLADDDKELTRLQDAAEKDRVTIPGLERPMGPMTLEQVQRLAKSIAPDPDYAKKWALKNKVFGAGEVGPEATDDAKKAAKQAVDRATEEGPQLVAKVWVIQQKILPPSGAMRTWPWKEDRGPNPFMLITGQAGSQWKEGHFGDWLLFKQVPVLLEPLVKLFSPVVYFFNPKAGSLVRFYCLLVMLWTLLVWGFFGGAITRIAAVQVARQEKVGLMDAMRFSARKYTSYLSAPLFPLVLVALLLILMVLFGYVQMIPMLGDLFDILLWGLMIFIGLAMAVVLIGLVGWPLMAATVSAEGTDAWEAVSRSYSYVYQAPWHYIWYSLVALAYGAVLVFFVGLMGSLTVYLSKFGVSQTPGINWRHADNKDRNPTYLFVYAPESFGWRKLLLQDDPRQLVNGEGQIDTEKYDKYFDSFRAWNYPSAVIVSIFWVGIIFMLVVGFGYSYFWSSATIIYLFMRRKVDDAELDEVYLEEEDEAAYAGPLAPKPAAPAAPAAAPVAASGGARPSLPIVEAPPRPVTVSVPPPAPPPPPPAAAAPEMMGTVPPAPPPAVEPPPPGPDGNPAPEA